MDIRGGCSNMFNLIRKESVGTIVGAVKSVIGSQHCEMDERGVGMSESEESIKQSHHTDSEECSCVCQAALYDPASGITYPCQEKCNHELHKCVLNSERQASLVWKDDRY